MPSKNNKNPGKPKEILQPTLESEAAPAHADSLELPSNPIAAKAEFEPIVYYCKICNSNYQFQSEKDKDGKWPPIKVISFRNHEVTIANAEDDALLRGHAMYELEFWPTSAPVPVEATGYISGRQNSGSIKV